MTSQEPTQPADDVEVDAEVVATPATPGAEALGTEAADEESDDS
jgi:hypothetical protein